MRLRFVGENGSMGLTTGAIYDVRFEPRNAPHNRPFTAIFLGKTRCPYDSDEAFWRNWAPPVEVGGIEVPDRLCPYSKRHAPHQWASSDGLRHCFGVAEVDDGE